MKRHDLNATGGGEPTCSKLTDMEERLLNIMGTRTVEGDRNKELGILSDVDVYIFYLIYIKI